MKILDVYLDKPNDLRKLFQGAEVDHAQIQTMLDKHYDVIYCSNSLQGVEAKEVTRYLRVFCEQLNDRGELWVITPSLEWAANEALNKEPNPVLNYVLYGPKEYPTRTGFTLALLRNLIEDAGLIARKAYQEQVLMQTSKGDIIVPQNVVIGWKVLP